MTLIHYTFDIHIRIFTRKTFQARLSCYNTNYKNIEIFETGKVKSKSKKEFFFSWSVISRIFYTTISSCNSTFSILDVTLGEGFISFEWHHPLFSEFETENNATLNALTNDSDCWHHQHGCLTSLVNIQTREILSTVSPYLKNDVNIQLEFLRDLICENFNLIFHFNLK